MKNMKCKGEEPALMTVKKEASDNPLLANMDASKHETKMQRNLTGQRNKYLTEKDKEAQAKAEQKALEDAKKTFQGEEEEEEPEAMIEERPTGIVQPKYKIVHSYPSNIQDSWGGY